MPGKGAGKRTRWILLAAAVAALVALGGWILPRYRLLLPKTPETGITDYTWEAVPSVGGVLTFDASAGRAVLWRNAGEVGSDGADRIEGDCRIMLDEKAASFIENNHGTGGYEALERTEERLRDENVEVRLLAITLHAESDLAGGVETDERGNIVWVGFWNVGEGRMHLTNLYAGMPFDYYAEFVPSDERLSRVP